MDTLVAMQLWRAKHGEVLHGACATHLAASWVGVVLDGLEAADICACRGMQGVKTRSDCATAQDGGAGRSSSTAGQGAPSMG